MDSSTFEGVLSVMACLQHLSSCWPPNHRFAAAQIGAGRNNPAPVFLHSQLWCRGSGGGGPAMQGIVPRYS
jgi:hypothetical protein